MQYKIMVTIGFIVWLLGTAYGGFQLEAQSVFEKITDFLGIVLVCWGIIGDLISNLKIVKEYRPEKMEVHNYGPVSNAIKTEK